MRVTALDTHDHYKEGDVYDVPEHHARELIRKGLVKAGPVPLNKMAPPSNNKANPTRAVGAEVMSSSLPAVQASQVKIAKLSDPGATATTTATVTINVTDPTSETSRKMIAETVAAALAPRRRGRPPKNRGGSSP